MVDKISKEVLYHYLELHKDYRKDRRQKKGYGFARPLEAGFYSLTGWWAGYEDPVEAQKTLYASIKKDIQTYCNTPENCINLLYLLDMHAKEALAKGGVAKQTGMSNKSLLCDTLHAMRNYIVSKMKNSNDEYGQAYQSEINRLNQKLDKYNLKQENLKKENLTAPRLTKAELDEKLQEIDRKRNQVYLKLATLEDENGITFVIKEKLVPHLRDCDDNEKKELEKILKKYKKQHIQDQHLGLDLSKPFAYQTDLYLICFILKYQSTGFINVDFYAFEAAAFKEEIKEKIKEQQHIATETTTTQPTITDPQTKEIASEPPPLKIPAILVDNPVPSEEKIVENIALETEGEEKQTSSQTHLKHGGFFSRQQLLPPQKSSKEIDNNKRPSLASSCII